MIQQGLCWNFIWYKYYLLNDKGKQTFFSMIVYFLVVIGAQLQGYISPAYPLSPFCGSWSIYLNSLLTPMSKRACVAQWVR
jgi:hypothetical protein